MRGESPAGGAGAAAGLSLAGPCEEIAELGEDRPGDPGEGDALHQAKTSASRSVSEAGIPASPAGSSISPNSTAPTEFPYAAIRARDELRLISIAGGRSIRAARAIRAAAHAVAKHCPKLHPSPRRRPSRNRR